MLTPQKIFNIFKQYALRTEMKIRSGGLFGKAEIQQGYFISDENLDSFVRHISNLVVGGIRRMPKTIRQILHSKGYDEGQFVGLSHPPRGTDFASQVRHYEDQLRNDE